MKKIQSKTLFLSSLKTGDVVLFHTPFEMFKPITWLAALIRFFERNYWNHAAIIDISDNRSVIIVQSLASGVCSSFLKDNILNKEIKILRLNSEFLNNPYFIECIKDRIIKGIGIKYDYSGCLIFQLFKQIGEVINNDLNLWFGRKGSKAANRFYCSEFVAWCLALPKWWELAPDDLDKHVDLECFFIGKINSVI